MKPFTEFVLILLGVLTLPSIYYGTVWTDYQLLSFYFFTSVALLVRRTLVAVKGVPGFIRDKRAKQ